MGGLTAWNGPIISFGQGAQSAPGQEYNEDAGPSLFYQGTGLLDPRLPYTYSPGNTNYPPSAWLSSCMIGIDAVPSAISAVNIAASQSPGAGAITLVSSSGAGITAGVSITNAATGATVTGLLAIDTAMSGVGFGQSPYGVKIWDPTKAVARNVRLTSGGNDSGITFTVSGYDLYGYAMTETITGANVGVASGAKAFKYVSGVTHTGSVAGTLTIGTGDVIGLPLRADYWGQVHVVYNNALVTASTGFTAAVTTSPATATTGDVRGTYALQSASDGTKRLHIYCYPSVANISSTTGLLGVTQA